jgi:hypothetical protein
MYRMQAKCCSGRDSDMRGMHGTQGMQGMQGMHGMHGMLMPRGTMVSSTLVTPALRKFGLS